MRNLWPFSTGPIVTALLFSIRIAALYCTLFAQNILLLAVGFSFHIPFIGSRDIISIDRLAAIIVRKTFLIQSFKPLAFSSPNNSSLYTWLAADFYGFETLHHLLPLSFAVHNTSCELLIVLICADNR